MFMDQGLVNGLAQLPHPLLSWRQSVPLPQEA
jgi:hypothetical protein